MVSKPPQSPVSASHAKKGKFRDLDLEFVKIGVPSLVQFTASPLAALVDAMYLGRLGPVALGGAGTAIAAQYSVAKLANDPLLRTSISLVATGSGEAAEGDDEASAQSALDLAVSTALLLAITVGAVQALFYSLASKGVIRGMGIGVENPMFGPAVSYLRVRALGAPAETLWLVTNGVFRGLGDTLTPLKWAAVLTVLNAVLDPLFIFSHVSFSFGGFLPVTLPGLQMGCAGAAAGTAVAQYVALGGILWELRRRASPCLDSTALLRSVKQYLSAVGTQSKPANQPASQLVYAPFLLL
jgi:Na+-driven multidrug efflux pump